MTELRHGYAVIYYITAAGRIHGSVPSSLRAKTPFRPGCLVGNKYRVTTVCMESDPFSSSNQESSMNKDFKSTGLAIAAVAATLFAVAPSRCERMPVAAMAPASA
jgi:hypothetical protein